MVYLFSLFSINTFPYNRVIDKYVAIQVILYYLLTIVVKRVR